MKTQRARRTPFALCLTERSSVQIRAGGVNNNETSKRREYKGLMGREGRFWNLGFVFTDGRIGRFWKPGNLDLTHIIMRHITVRRRRCV